MSRFTCGYCGRNFAERVRRPPDCPTQDCCDIQEETTAEEIDPLTEFLAAREAALPARAIPSEITPPPQLEPAPPVTLPTAPAPAASANVSGGWSAGTVIGGFILTGPPVEISTDTYAPASHPLSGEAVTVRRYRPIGTQQPGLRAELRRLLDSHGNPSFLRLLHFEANGAFSVEVLEQPHGPSLRQHAAGRPMSLDALRPIISRLSGLIAQLHTPRHGRRIVHRGLSLDTIFIHFGPRETPELELGGWEAAMVLTAQTDVTYSIAMPDVKTAPPESVGKTTFCFDATAASWDWWSLGRIVQELLLGRHVFDLLPSGGVEAQHLRQSILLDEDTTRYSPQGVRFRPGLVEIMGWKPDAPARPLLRGLLACNPRARWRAPAVDSWLAGEKTDDPYDLSAAEPVFTWAGQAFVVSEAAKFLLTQAPWEEAVSNFLDSAQPSRLSYQILHVYKARRYIEAFDSASKLLAEPRLAECPRAFREGLATALFLSSVAGFQDTLVMSGQIVDQAWLQARLQEATTPETVDRVVREIGALLEPTVLRRIESQFATTGRLLRETQGIYDDASRALERQREILDLRNARDRLVLLKLVLADPAFLAAESAATRQAFHDSSLSPWKEIWAATESASRAAQVLILVARLDVAKARLRTQEQWANEQIDSRRTDAARYYNFLIHAHAYRVMLWGAPTFAGPIGFGILLAGGGSILLHGLKIPLAGPGWIGVVLVALSLRTLGWFFIGQYLSRRLGSEVELPFFSLTSHLASRVEKLQVVVKGQRQYTSDALAFVENINDEIRQLTPPSQKARLFACWPPTLPWVIVGLHWLILVTGLLLHLR